jgi:molybdopterin molybdotransferase
MAVSGQTPLGTGAGLLEIEEARRLIIAAAAPLEGEPVELVSALGRVLAEDALAPDPVPAFDGSAMDGFALRAADLLGATQDRPVTLEVVGESRAGTPAEVALAAGQAIAISTGAVIPQGADTVVRVEDTRPAPSAAASASASREGGVEIRVEASVGTDVRYAGEDIQAGERVLAKGTPLGPAELGVLASLGGARALCFRRPRLSLLVSGDELIGLGDPSRPGGVRDSNSLTISALARRAGAEVVREATVGDDPEATRDALAASLTGVDVAIICGGVSVGVHDHMRPALAELGAEERFWGVALKPGRPTWFGTLGETLIFGLPGNPVSAMATFLLLLQPALRRMLGLSPEASRISAVMDEDYSKPPGRAHAVRCSLTTHQDGWHARPTGPQGSHILTSMLGADGLALIATDSEGVRAGERVEVEPLRLWQEALS